MMQQLLQSRRAFLKRSTAAAALGVAAVHGLGGTRPLPARAAQTGATGRTPPTPDQFRQRLEGPICSIPTPFTVDHEVDYAAIGTMIRRALDHGITIFALTAGNSQYHALSYDEITQLTQAVVEAVDGRGLAIAATGDWWTGRAVEYAQFAESVGADAVQVQLPARHGGEDALVEHFRTIAGSTRLPLALHGNFSASLLRKLLEIDSIVAMKEDLQLTYFIDRQIEFGDRLEIFAGGAENRFLVGYPHGARAFYSVYTSFAPDVAMPFWEAIQAGDIKRAAEITRKYDYPFIQRFSHSFWRAAMEHFGVAQRHIRPPQVAFTDEQMEDVKQFFDAQGLSPERYQ